MKVLAVLGARWEPPDIYLEAAAKFGVTIDARTPPDGDDLPADEAGHDGLIILDGRCYKDPVAEFGIHRIYPTAEAALDPLLPPIPEAGFRTLQFHFDTFDLPDGAVRLMRGDNYDNQAFRMGVSTYGFQPHFEISPGELRTWLYQGPGAAFLKDHPEVLAELDAEMELCGEVHGPLTTTLGGRWFDLVVKRHEPPN